MKTPSLARGRLARLVGLGAMNLDLFYTVERVVTDGETLVKSAARHPGGSAANTIYGLARLGIKAGFVGAIGDDSEGKLLLESFASVGVDTSHISVKAAAPTGSVLAITDALGRRALYVSPGANNALTLEDINLDYLNRAFIVHFSAFASEKQLELQKEIARRLAPSVKMSFAPGALYAARGIEAIKPLLSKTHTLFLNRTEIKQLTGQDFRVGAATCLDLGCQQVAVTLGKGMRVPGVKGVASAFIRDADKEYFIPALKPPGKVLDTTGAGDAFAAGFLFGLLQGETPYRCGLLATTVAAFSVIRLGARAGLPTRERLLATLAHFFTAETQRIQRGLNG